MTTRWSDLAGWGRGGRLLLAFAVGALGSGPRGEPLRAQEAPREAPRGDATARVTGTVVDRQTQAPVAAARIHLLHPGSPPQRTAADSDSLGVFALPAVPPGTYGFLVERMGYRQVEDSLTLEDGEELELSVELVPEAVDLEPLVVRVPRNVAYYMRDFERRRASGNGTFITRSQIERRRPNSTSELLRSVGGLRVQYGTRGEAALFLRGTCRPQVYIDGVATFQGVSIDMAVLPMDIEGVEVYSNATVPPQYASMSPCGVILVWTRPAVRVEGSGHSLWKMLIGGVVLVAILILQH